MKKVITAGVALAIMSLTACASGPTLTTIHEKQDISIPTIDESKTINIGEKLYLEDTRMVTRYMKIPTNVKVTAEKSSLGMVNFTFNLHDQLRERHYLISEYPAKKACGYETMMLTCYSDTDGDNLIDTVKQGSEGDVIYQVNTPFPIKYYNKAQGTGGVWFELIYSGKTKDTIKVTYREFTGSNLIRDAFTQYLEYPIENGKTQIDYKGISLSITGIKGSRLTYTRTQ